MKLLSIEKPIQYTGLNITSITTSALSAHPNVGQYDYIIINGGDGTIRRVLTHLQHIDTIPPLILNPTGSFNVVAKIYRVPKVEHVLKRLAHHETPKTQKHHYFKLNEHLFLFSAGNMGDLQHIFLSETLRFGWLKHGMAKYLLAALFLFPVHLVMTPFMLLSSTRFFIFTPARFLKKFGSFYGEVPKKLHIDLENRYNLLELDGDIVTITESNLHISHGGFVRVVAG